MRDEQLFSKGGYYAFLLDSNVLLHREAVVATRQALLGWVTRRPTAQTLTVLDLACGGMPVTICNALSGLAPRRFAYTGVDINADQVTSARRFVYPTNVVEWQVIEGSAWDLPAAVLSQPFDVVYSGMNLHHAIEEELQYLAQQLARVLAPGGVFISHDVYRPGDEPYLRRPAVNPLDANESFRLVEVPTLAGAGITERGGNDSKLEQRCAWREDYLGRMRQTLLERGADPSGTDETVTHMRERDFPLSVAEFGAVFTRAGFHVEETELDSSEPLAPYVSVVSAVRTPREG